MADLRAEFVTTDPTFATILRSEAKVQLLIDETSTPWAHEACVYIPTSNELYVTSNRILEHDGGQRIDISKVNLNTEHPTAEKIVADISMANGGVNYLDGILFCAQGTHEKSSGLVQMNLVPPYSTKTVVESFNGRPFNSPNDVVVHLDGSIWFTDPIYGFEQGFRPQPELPNQVYRFNPANGSIRAVADGFDRPNGISFSPDQLTLYVTDTGYIHGDGTKDPTRPSSIYAFDVISRHGEPFLTNRRLFAMADGLLPDGIKCDTDGNVYSGCADGISVWSPGGVLLGKVVIPGGVANFCFGHRGFLYALNETRLWRVELAPNCTGALLNLYLKN